MLGAARPFTFRGSRIVGGVMTQIEDYPHAVSITRNDEHECGGSIVSLQTLFKLKIISVFVIELQNIVILSP